MSGQGSIVIICGGHAGTQLCHSLVADGHAGSVHLVCDDPELPYHRIPMSKSFLKEPTESAKLIRLVWRLSNSARGFLQSAVRP